MSINKIEQEAFEAIKGQSFFCHQDWVNRASRVLTSHPKYHNTEHDGPAKGWRGEHFTAMCFDQLGRRIRNGGDFRRAAEDNAFPVWWIWPDQISALIMRQVEPASLSTARQAVR